MLAHAATPEQAKRMVEEHLLNPREFRGEWVIPAISRDDPTFKDQDYWHGRIWGPMNYLVYLGLCNYDGREIDDARRELAQKSYKLFSSEWTRKGHVHENYNAITGNGDDVTNSDKFYHWGALLGYIQYLEETRNDTKTATHSETRPATSAKCRTARAAPPMAPGGAAPSSPCPRIAPSGT
jgi:glycogen debranching enzyme